jgi:hypothetical protein
MYPITKADRVHNANMESFEQQRFIQVNTERHTRLHFFEQQPGPFFLTGSITGAAEMMGSR